jgi:hypothetical protein
MTPIKVADSNFILLGPNKNVSDMHCRRDSGGTTIIWQPTEAERRLIAEGGNVRLQVIYAHSLPPMALDAVPNEGQFKEVSAPCQFAVSPNLKCNQEPSSLVHAYAEGPLEGHAYRCRETGN